MTTTNEIATTKTLTLAEAAKVELTPENVMATYPLEILTSLKGRRALEIFSDKDLLKPYIDQIHEVSTSVIYDFSINKQYTACGSASKKVSSSRKAITDAIALSIAAEQAKVNKAKEVKKFVETEMNITRDAVLAPRKAYDEEQAKLEQKRIDDIKARIDSIRNLAELNGDESKEKIGALISAVDSMPIDESFEEYAGTANEAKIEALNKLNDAVFAIAEKEQQEATRLALEAEQKKAAIETRINNLKQTPLSFMGKPAIEIKAKLESIQSYEPLAEDFEDRLNETNEAKAMVVMQLQMMLDQASQMEVMQKEAEALRQENEKAQREAEQLKKEREESSMLKKVADKNVAHYKHDELKEPSNQYSVSIEESNPAIQGIEGFHEAEFIAQPKAEEVAAVTQLCPDDAPLYSDCLVTAAMAEVCSETKQQQAANVLVELTGGELTIELATEVIGLIDANVVPFTSFN